MISGNLSFLACLLFCSTFLNIKANDIPKKPKIVVIGAGPAGLAAGTKLLEYGLKDFKILEAEPRFGGRIHTIPFADNVIDIGAQWCHGQENNVVYDLVKNLNFLDSSAENMFHLKLARSNGVQIESAVQERLDQIGETLREHVNEYDNENRTALDYIKTEFFKALEKPENKHINRTVAEEFFVNFEKGESCYESADSVAEIPARGDPDYEACGGDLHLNWKDKGYKQFLKFLLKTEETSEEFGVLKNHLELSKKVKHIEWQRDDLRVRILCEDGEEILADHAIVTVSLGVLKAKHAELFEPALPPHKQKAIENLDFGSANKIYFEFEKPFWPENWNGFSLLWRDEDLKQIRATDKAWLEGLFGFHVVSYQPRLLEGWMVGKFGRIMETLPLDFVRNEILALMQRSLPWAEINVKNFTITKWFSNPNFRGTYSYYSMKAKANGVKSYDLEVPLMVGNNGEKRPVVLFAGEATNTKHAATVHGAVETGWREAKRLADYYGMGKD